MGTAPAWLDWGRPYDRSALRPDLVAGLTIGAMLVPQAMAYALLAGLPPQVGLYASIAPVLVYALIGTSRQLAVGPVAIVSLMTASAVAPLAGGDVGAYLALAGVLALLVGVIHIVLAVARLGFLVDLLSHAVLVGFTAAAAIIIGTSQVKHLLGVTIERHEHFHETVTALLDTLGDVHSTTVVVGLASLTVVLGSKRWLRRVPGALAVVVLGIVVSRAFDLAGRGVAVVGEIPQGLPSLGLPAIDGGSLPSLLAPAAVITLVGFMESIAVAKTYARRHGHELDADRELLGLGAANLAAGVSGGYPVTGGFSRTAVNDAAGARTPLASIVTALLVVATVAFFTPLLAPLPLATLGAIIVSAVIGLVDVAEMRHIATVKRSDLISLVTAFVATLALGIELGIAVAVVTSLLVIVARLSRPHHAVLGHVAGTTSYRNVERFPEAVTTPGVCVLRIDAPVTFVSAAAVRRRLLDHAASTARGGALVLDASGINDLDATGADMLDALIDDLGERGIALHLADVKGPVRDVLRRCELWDRLAIRIHTSSHDAVAAIADGCGGPTDLRRSGVDEHPDPRHAMETR